MAKQNYGPMRDLHPHAEARFAMWKWSSEYARKGLGSMGFYDQLNDYRKRLCKDAVDEILRDVKENGRATRTDSKRDGGREHE